MMAVSSTYAQSKPSRSEDAITKNIDKRMKIMIQAEYLRICFLPTDLLNRTYDCSVILHLIEYTGFLSKSAIVLNFVQYTEIILYIGS